MDVILCRVVHSREQNKSLNPFTPAILERMSFFSMRNVFEQCRHLRGRS